jgi:RNA polymerase sigma-70 factor (ECF subfamily)
VNCLDRSNLLFWTPFGPRCEIAVVRLIQNQIVSEIRMAATPASLLMRLRGPADPKEWDRLFELYAPLLFYWTRRSGISGADAEDVVQEVWIVLVKTLPTFAYDRTRGFRKWLRTVTLNKSRDHLRRTAKELRANVGGDLSEVEGPADAEPFWEVEYRQYLVRRLLDLMRSEFQTTTWQACWKCTVEGKTALEAASELDLTPGAVRAAKFRVLSALRTELAGLLD